MLLSLPLCSSTMMSSTFFDVLWIGRLAGPAAEAAVARAVALVVVERHGRDVLALDVLPDVQLGPVEQRVDAHVRARREVGLELVPELGRLIADVPVVVLVARREVALLRAAALLVGARADDDAGVRLACRRSTSYLPVVEVEAHARPRRRAASRLSASVLSRPQHAVRDCLLLGAHVRVRRELVREGVLLGERLPCSGRRSSAACTPSPAGRGTRSSPASCSWCRCGPAGTARGRRTPCAPATAGPSSPCRSTRACTRRSKCRNASRKM